MGRPRCRECGDVEHVLFGQLVGDRLHQIDPRAVARAGLHVAHLPHEIARRAAGEARDRSNPFQLVTVATVHCVVLPLRRS